MTVGNMNKKHSKYLLISGILCLILVIVLLYIFLVDNCNIYILLSELALGIGTLIYNYICAKKELFFK
jgi:hypothetical protein